MRRFVAAYWPHLVTSIGAAAVIIAAIFGARLALWEVCVWMGTLTSWVWLQAASERRADAWRALYQTEKQKRKAIWS